LKRSRHYIGERIQRKEKEDLRENLILLGSVSPTMTASVVPCCFMH